jgi:MFS family permease
MVALGLGQSLEFYDWTIFGLVAAYVGPAFFAPGDPTAATLSALAVFAVGFAARPLGGVLLGAAADRIGRRNVMLLAITLMATGTGVIAMTPTYSQIGIWAPIILLLCRIGQGVSAGVEAPLGTIYAVELSAPGQEGRAGGLMASFVYVGTLAAGVVAFVSSWVLGADAMREWGWRIPFIVGALAGVLVIYLRRALPESLSQRDGDSGAAEDHPSVRSGVRKHWLGLVAIVFVVGCVQAQYYTWAVGMPNLARSTFDENPTMVFGIASISSLILVLGCLPVGRLADRFKISRVATFSRVVAIPSMFLMLAYNRPGIITFTVIMVLGTVVLLLNVATYNVTATTLMPMYCRGTGVSIGYGVAAALFGGTASYLLVWLQDIELHWVFPVYVAVLAALSVVTYYVARKRSGIFAGE